MPESPSFFSIRRECQYKSTRRQGSEALSLKAWHFLHSSSSSVGAAATPAPVLCTSVAAQVVATGVPTTAPLHAVPTRPPGFASGASCTAQPFALPICVLTRLHHGPMMPPWVLYDSNYMHRACIVKLSLSARVQASQHIGPRAQWPRYQDQPEASTFH